MARKSNTFAEPRFHDENAARDWFEAARWPDGPVCPHCKSTKHYATKKVGRYRCAAKDCRKDFTVMTGSVMERSHAKLTQWAHGLLSRRRWQEGLLGSPAPSRLGIAS